MRVPGIFDWQQPTRGGELLQERDGRILTAHGRSLVRSGWHRNAASNGENPRGGVGFANAPRVRDSSRSGGEAVVARAPYPSNGYFFNPVN